VFNVVDAVESQSFPVVLAKLAALFILERTEEETSKVEGFIAFSNNEREIIRNPVNVEFGDKLRLRVILTVAGIPVHEIGTFSASFIYEDRELGRWNMVVTQLPLPNPQVKIQ
jgi:hypothetical protein